MKLVGGLFAAVLGLAQFFWPSSVAAASPEEIRKVGEAAYYYGLQQVIFYETRYNFTQVQDSNVYTGVNRFTFPNGGNPITSDFTAIVTPNATTLYGTAFLDMQTEPVVVEMPEITDRYFSLQLMDQYGIYFLYAGNQFNGTTARSYLVRPDGWKGQTPDNFAAIDVIGAPTISVWAIVRFGLADPNDEAEVARIKSLQARVTITPLSQWVANGKKGVVRAEQPVIPGTYETFARMAELTSRQVELQTAEDFFTLLNLVLNDPRMLLIEDSAKEIAMLDRLETIGIGPGRAFDWAGLDGATRDALAQGFKTGFETVKGMLQSRLFDMNGWGVLDISRGFRTDWQARAFVADIGWAGPDRPISHTATIAFADADGKPLDGNNSYTMTFNLDNLPPVTEFWSLPIYDAQGYFVANDINRYTINSFLLDKGLLDTTDGKLVIHIQHEKPRNPDQLKNWLPAPDGAFRMTPRFYGPKTPLIEGTYEMPKIVRVE
jgi:hypothetical protein